MKTLFLILSFLRYRNDEFSASIDGIYKIRPDYVQTDYGIFQSNVNNREMPYISLSSVKICSWYFKVSEY